MEQGDNFNDVSSSVTGEADNLNVPVVLPLAVTVTMAVPVSVKVKIMPVSLAL